MTEQHENPNRGARQYCSVPKCSQSFADHYWGAIKAHNDGWYRQKAGPNWCPKHRPSWAPEFKVENVEAESVGTVTKAVYFEVGDGRRLYSPEVEITPVKDSPGKVSIHAVVPFEYV